MEYIKDRGLSVYFKLQDGKFSFTQGSDKKRADLLFFMGFDFTRRIYRPEFKPGLSWVIQKTMNYVQSVQVLLLGNLKTKILSFIDSIEVKSLQIGRSRQDKTYFLALDYAYFDDTREEVKQLITVL
jgi:hypothetical protein